MAQDQNFNFKDHNGINLTPVSIPLNLDNEMFLIQFFDSEKSASKKYLRAQMIMIHDHILTSTFSDTMHFMKEINLFDYGNHQNKFLVVTDYKATKNLKLNYKGEVDVFISKSEAQAIYEIFRLSFQGYSLVTLLEQELRLTHEILTSLLHWNKYLKGRK